MQEILPVLLNKESIQKEVPFGNSSQSLLYSHALDKFISYITVRNYSVRTIIKYRKELEELFAFLLDTRKVHYLDDVTKKDLLEYENHVYSSCRIKDQRPLSQETKVGKIVALKSLFNFLSRTEMIPYNPAENISIPIVSRHKLREILSEEEVFKLLNSIKGETPLEIRDRSMLELLYSTGIRAEELISIMVKDLDIENEELRIRCGKGRFGKRERIVPVGKIAVECIKSYLSIVRPSLQKREDEGYLFLTNHGSQLSINDPRRRAISYARRCGIDKKVGCHTFRHTCATHMLKRGCDIRFVQELLGHDSLNTTVIYTKLVIDDLKEIHQKTHPREKAA